MGKEVNKEYLSNLVQQTGLIHFLQALPLGYDTELDPAGKRLPQNVMQKILLVRALVHQPQLLLLEEPWRGIDDPYKTNIRQLLLSLEATVIVATNDEHFMPHVHQVIHL